MEVSIRTAQNIDVLFQPAGLLYRLGATLIDFSFLGGLFIIVLVLINPLLSEGSTNIFLILLGVLLLLYHLLCEFFFQGRSLGKLVLNLRVIRLDGRKLSLWDCLLRWSLRLIDISTTFGIGATISILTTSHQQRIGDLAAGTTVVFENTPPKLNPFKTYDLPEEYQVTFPQVTMLSDRDISIIKEVLKEVNKIHDDQLLSPLADKIKQLTAIRTEMNPMEFIQTVLKDYFYLTKN